MANRGFIYHICQADEWVDAEVGGTYFGSSQDREDGFIHFSSALQVVDSAAKHRAGQDNLILLEVDPNKLGSALKWEVSRNGAKYPHLYGNLPITAVERSFRLRIGPGESHLFPENWGLS